MKDIKIRYNGIILILMLGSFGLANSNYNFTAKSETTNVKLSTIKEEFQASVAKSIFLESVPKPVDGYQSLHSKCTYPWAAKVLKKEVEILIWILVDADGNVAESKIIQGGDNTVFAQEVTAVVESSKWIPARREGKPVVVGMYIPFKFKI